MAPHSPAEKPSGKSLELLIRCLRRYVELNAGRFETHQQGGQKRIVTVFVAKRKTPG
jgi:hypothetical protein